MYYVSCMYRRYVCCVYIFVSVYCTWCWMYEFVCIAHTVKLHMYDVCMYVLCHVCMSYMMYVCTVVLSYVALHSCTPVCPLHTYTFQAFSSASGSASPQISMSMCRDASKRCRFAVDLSAALFFHRWIWWRTDCGVLFPWLLQFLILSSLVADLPPVIVLSRRFCRQTLSDKKIAKLERSSILCDWMLPPRR